MRARAEGFAPHSQKSSGSRRARASWGARESVGIVQKQYFHFASARVPFLLESGQSLDSVTIAYESYGEPNADRSNAILICHALSGDSHAAGYYSESDQKPGWWEDSIGPGKLFDTRRYWVICSNILGGCQGSTGPSSLNPATGKAYGMSFPVVTIRDMVEAQRKLMDNLGISEWWAVAGGSMGGFQALEWSVRYPQRVKSTIVLASAAKLSTQGIAFNAVGRHAIVSDPEWKQGDYKSLSGEVCPVGGLATARMLAHITYLSSSVFERRFGRTLQEQDDYSYGWEREFSVESYLHHQGSQFLRRFDANSYLYISKAMDYFDLARSFGTLENAFAGVQSRCLIIASRSDWLFPLSDSEALVRALYRSGHAPVYAEIDSEDGHDAFLTESGQIEKAVAPFLEGLSSASKVHSC